MTVAIPKHADRRPLTAHRQRRQWHVLLRYWRQRINYILMVGLVAVLLVLAVAVPAEAQTTVRCRTRGTQPGFYHPAPRGVTRTVGQCFAYRPGGVLP